MVSVVACVLAGGVGTRLYPASRSDRPKQFLPFGGEESLLTRTIARTGFADATVVLTRPAFADRVPEHAPDARVLVEPEARDTGPAVVYAAGRIRALAAAGAFDGVPTDAEPVIVTLPSDHHVPEPAVFERTMARGARIARETDRPVTFGVEPTRPDTGYGYVEPGEDHGDWARVDQFHEKPDRATAKRYVERGCYWNAGIFAWTPTALFEACVDTPLAELATVVRDRHPATDAAGDVAETEPARWTDETTRTDAADRTAVQAAFEHAPTVSVDTAVMERTDRAAVVPASFAWDDLGSWDALGRTLPTDADGNARETQAVTIDATDNVIAGDHHVSVVGVDGLCVVAVEDRVVVVPKDDAQRVRAVVDRLREEDAF